MSIIPNVVDAIRASKKTREIKPRGPNYHRLEKAGAEFTEFLKKEICDQLEYQCHAEIRLKRLGSYQGIPGDVLLYGHRKSSLNKDDWYQRSDLGLDEMPFRTLQNEFREQGWYLIEETNPSISREFVFKVYASEPKNHPYYNKKSLWHYHNFVHPSKPSAPKPTVPKPTVPKPTVPKPTVPKPTVVEKKGYDHVSYYDPESLYPSLMVWQMPVLPSWDLNTPLDKTKDSVKPDKDLPKTKETKVETSDKPVKEKRKRSDYYVCSTKDMEPQGADFRRFRIVNPDRYDGLGNTSLCSGRTLLEAAKRAFIRIADAIESFAIDQIPEVIAEQKKYPQHPHISFTFALEEIKRGRVVGVPKKLFEFHGYRSMLEKKLHIISPHRTRSEEVMYEYGVTEIKSEEDEKMPELVDISKEVESDNTKEEKIEQKEVPDKDCDDNKPEEGVPLEQIPEEFRPRYEPQSESGM